MNENRNSPNETTIRISVMADDFGMHEAVNQGIVEAFLNGLLTDANVMAPCPAFKDAARLAHETGLPVGMHSTFTCEFDLYRWGPLTPMKTLVAGDGMFPRSHLWENVDMDEARRELFAQYDALREAGLDLTHLSQHMGLDENDRFARLQAELSLAKALPHRTHSFGRAAAPFHYAIDGFVRVSSVSGLDKRKQRLREQLLNLKPGSFHIWVVHPGADHPSLDRLASPESSVFDWGRPYRVQDLALLLDPEVGQWLKDLNIVPTPIRECPTHLTAPLRPHA